MLDPNTPVGTLVLDHSELASVFTRHRIDYCCKGTASLREACDRLGLDVHQILGEAQSAVETRAAIGEVVDPRFMSLSRVIVQLVAPHHQYLHRTMPFIQMLAAKVARVHGDREPSLAQVAHLVDTLCETLRAHLAEEEQILFPALMTGHAGDVRIQLAAMRGEHEQVGALLAALRDAAKDYVPPDWACRSYRTLMSELAVLEADTFAHVHLENHVLLPRAPA